MGGREIDNSNFEVYNKTCQKENYCELEDLDTFQLQKALSKFQLKFKNGTKAMTKGIF